MNCEHKTGFKISEMRRSKPTVILTRRNLEEETGMMEGMVVRKQVESNTHPRLVGIRVMLEEDVGIEKGKYFVPRYVNMQLEEREVIRKDIRLWDTVEMDEDEGGIKKVLLEKRDAE